MRGGNGDVAVAVVAIIVFMAALYIAFSLLRSL